MRERAGAGLKLVRLGLSPVAAGGRSLLRTALVAMQPVRNKVRKKKKPLELAPIPSFRSQDLRLAPKYRHPLKKL